MFNFKKIAAIGASALMIGMTAGVATAANYPAPFVVGGSADVAVVYGTGSGVSILDAVEAGNLQSNLQSFMAGSGGTTSTTIGGDSVLLAKSSDNMNLGNAWDVFTGTIDDDDLTSLLADGEYIADDNDNFDYEQKITLGNPTLTHFRDSDYESEVGLTVRTPVVGFKLSSNTFVLNYTLDFVQDAESDVSGGYLVDFEGSDLTLFGKTFFVSDWKNGSSTSTTGKLTLLDSAVKTTVNEGETASVTVDGTTYAVSLDFIGSSTVKFNINGELTNTLSTGQTFRLADDAYVGVREINTQDYQGGIKTVEFSIGSGKLELTHAADIKLNDDTIQGVKAYLIKGTVSSGVEKVSKIVIEWTTDEEEFLTPESELVMPGFGGVKFTMADFIRPVEEKVTIQPDGDESIEISVPIKDGTVTFNLLFSTAGANSGNFTGLGKASDERLITSATNQLNFSEKDSSGNDLDEWFVASYNISSEAESYLLRARITTDTTNDRNETTIQKHDGSGWVDVCVEKIAGDTCDIGLVTLTIDNIDFDSGGLEQVDLTGGADVNFHTIYTKGGLRIYLPFELENGTTNGAIDLAGLGSGTVGHSADSWYLFMDGEDKDDDIADGTEFNLTIDATAGTNNPLHVSQVNLAGTGGASGLELGDTSVYETYIVDDVAPRILHYTNPDEDWAEVYYPTGNSESYAEVFLAEIGATITAGTAATVGAAQLGDVLVKDTEISSVSSKNLIVVGGSCINSVAAKVLGAGCGADFTAKTTVGSGQFLIKSVEGVYTSGKIALVVAGYEVSDTVNAAKYLRTQAVDTTAGKTYIGTTSTSAELLVE